MSESLRDPPVPPECDLRDFPFLPLEGRRLLSSESWILGSPAERCAALCLLIEAWHQVPAASLPADDRMLAHFSQTGAHWAEVKIHAMRGWFKAIDGRLYHPVLVTKAIDAWTRKKAQREQTAAARAARAARQRRDSVTTETTPVTEPVTDSTGQGQGQGQGERNKPLTPLSGAPPDVPRQDKSTSKATEKRLALEASERAIAYLNEKAGTRFQITSANLKLPIARMLYDNATEVDLKAVVDLKAAEAARGEFDRKYLRPATLWNAEKFSQYIGQVGARPPAPAPRAEPLKVYSETEAGDRRLVNEYPAGNVEDAARRVLAEYANAPWMRSSRNLIVRANGAESKFSVAELRGVH